MRTDDRRRGELVRAVSREDVQEWRHRRKLQSGGWRHVAADTQDVWRWRKQDRKRSAKKESTGRRVDQVMSELNEARITRMLRERSDDDIDRLIKASVNWSKESLGVSDEIEEGIRNMLERFQHERLAEEGDRRRGPPKRQRMCESRPMRSGRTS